MYLQGCSCQTERRSSQRMADRRLAPRSHLQHSKAQVVARLAGEVVQEVPAVEVAGHPVLLLLRPAWVMHSTLALRLADPSPAQWLQAVHHRRHRHLAMAVGHTSMVPAELVERRAQGPSHSEGSHLTIHDMLRQALTGWTAGSTIRTSPASVMSSSCNFQHKTRSSSGSPIW